MCPSNGGWSIASEAEQSEFRGFEEAMIDSPQIHEFAVLALRTLGQVAVLFAMAGALVWQHTYLRISGHAARTILCALLLLPLFGAPSAAVVGGG